MYGTRMNLAAVDDPAGRCWETTARRPGFDPAVRVVLPDDALTHSTLFSYYLMLLFIDSLQLYLATTSSDY